MELIDREKLKDEIAVLFERNAGLIDEWLANTVDDVIDELPTIDAVPVKHGAWEYIGGYGYQFRCSECVMCVEHKTKYCPHCGARMDGEQDEI